MCVCVCVCVCVTSSTVEYFAMYPFNRKAVKLSKY